MGHLGRAAFSERPFLALGTQSLEQLKGRISARSQPLSNLLVWHDSFSRRSRGPGGLSQLLHLSCLF